MISEVCDKLKQYLQNWYDIRKNVVADDYFKKFSKNQPLTGHELKLIKYKFFEENPEYNSYSKDIDCSFIVVPDSCTHGCLCGSDDCDIYTHVRCTGVKVEPINWEKIKKLALSPIKIKDYIEEKEEVSYKGNTRFNGCRKTFKGEYVYLYRSCTLEIANKKAINQNL